MIPETITKYTNPRIPGRFRVTQTILATLTLKSKTIAICLIAIDLTISMVGNQWETGVTLMSLQLSLIGTRSQIMCTKVQSQINKEHQKWLKTQSWALIQANKLKKHFKLIYRVLSQDKERSLTHRNSIDLTQASIPICCKCKASPAFHKAVVTRLLVKGRASTPGSLNTTWQCPKDHSLYQVWQRA